MNRLPVRDGEMFTVWRLLLMGGALWAVVSSEISASWAFLLSMHLVAGTVAVYLFSHRELERWSSKGFVLATDAMLVGLALIGTRSQPPQLMVAFFGIVLTSLLVAGRARSALASFAMLATLLALAGVGVLPTIDWTAFQWVHATLLIAAAMHFSQLSDKMTSSEVTQRSGSSEVWALLEITEMVGKSLDLGQVMRSVVHRVGDLVNTDSCSVLLAEGDGDNGFVVASKGHPEIDMLKLDLSKYPEVRQALDSREAVAIQDVESSVVLEEVRDFLIARGYRSVLVLPLIFGDEVLGALTLRSRSPFTQEEVRFCKVAAGASANAIKNALLYREMKHEAAQNREKGEKLRRLLDCSPDVIVATDNEGCVVEFNRGAEALTGWSVGRAMGVDLGEILGCELDEFEAAPADEPQDIRFARDSHEVEISLVSAPLMNDEREVGRVWIGRDVTKLRRVEKSLAQAERLSSLGEVVAGVAHELNNPLSGVVGYAELLRVQANEPEHIRDLDRIVDSAIRCQKIVMKLLSFARQHPVEKRLQSVNECVTKVLDLKSYHLRASQIETVLDLQEDLPETCFDFHQIEQVILNLLNNAEQSLGTVRRPGKIILRTREVAGQIQIDIEDDGPGIPKEVRDRIFDPFFTTKELGEGTGLGLSVSYGIVEEHGGHLELDPANDGARFSITLPIQTGPRVVTPALDPLVELAERPLNGCRILVAEDEPLCLELFARVLRDEGADVTLSKDGEEAWDRMCEQDFDLVIVDVRMPNLSGKQLYERVAEERPDMLRRFVFATGDLVRPETLNFLQDLPNRILQKPLEVETVKRVLGQAVAS